MESKILMPALSPTMEVGRLAKWYVREGENVSSGDILAEIETDKAIMEYESPDDGVVTRILVQEGSEEIPVNTPIAVLSSEGEASVNVESPQHEPTETHKAPDEKHSADKKSNIVVSKSYDVIQDTSIPEGTPLKSMTVREALRDAMAEEMRLDETVFLMGEEVAEYQGAYKVSQGLLEEFGPTRVIDTPITEHGFTGLGVGAGFAGLRPIVEFMTFNFSMQAIDQIVNSAAKTLYMSGGQMGCPIVFRGPNGAAARVAAQHSQDYASWFAHIPGLKVIMPYCSADAKGLLKSAIRDPNPVVFLENEILYGHTFDVPELDDFTVPIGKACIRRPGTDVTIISFGIGMHHVMNAIENLVESGLNPEVIDLRSLRPLDTKTIIDSVKKTNRCVTVEEGWPVCSIGNYISSILMQEAFDWLDAPVVNCTGKDVPMPYAANLEKLALVSTEEIVKAVKSVCYRQE